MTSSIYFEGGQNICYCEARGQLSRGGWDRAVQIINEPGGLLWLLCRILSSPRPPLPPFQFIGLHLHAVPWKLPSLCDWNLRRPWRSKKMEIVLAAKAGMCSYLKKGFWERGCVGDGGGQDKTNKKTWSDLNLPSFWNLQRWTWNWASVPTYVSSCNHWNPSCWKETLSVTDCSLAASKFSSFCTDIAAHPNPNT